MNKILIASFLLLPCAVKAQDKSAAKPAEKAAEKAEPTERYSTQMDFDSTMIDGKMKAPAGFFLQGRNKQSLTNMVKLRSNFKPQLQDSKAAVKALVK